MEPSPGLALCFVVVIWDLAGTQEREIELEREREREREREILLSKKPLAFYEIGSSIRGNGASFWTFKLSS